MMNHPDRKNTFVYIRFEKRRVLFFRPFNETQGKILHSKGSL